MLRRSISRRPSCRGHQMVRVPLGGLPVVHQVLVADLGGMAVGLAVVEVLRLSPGCTCCGRTSRHLRWPTADPSATRCRTWHRETSREFGMPAVIPAWVQRRGPRSRLCCTESERARAEHAPPKDFSKSRLFNVIRSSPFRMQFVERRARTRWVGIVASTLRPHAVIALRMLLFRVGVPVAAVEFEEDRGVGNRQSVLMMSTRKTCADLVELGDDLLVRQLPLHEEPEHGIELLAVRRNARRVYSQARTIPCRDKYWRGHAARVNGIEDSARHFEAALRRRQWFQCQAWIAQDTRNPQPRSSCDARRAATGCAVRVPNRVSSISAHRPCFPRFVCGPGGPHYSRSGDGASTSILHPRRRPLCRICPRPSGHRHRRRGRARSGA